MIPMSKVAAAVESVVTMLVVVASDSLFAVDLSRVKHSVTFSDRCPRFGVDSSEEAASVTRMTGGTTKLIYLHQERIRIAIEVEAF